MNEKTAEHPTSLVLYTREQIWFISLSSSTWIKMIFIFRMMPLYALDIYIPVVVHLPEDSRTTWIWSNTQWCMHTCFQSSSEIWLDFGLILPIKKTIQKRPRRGFVWPYWFIDWVIKQCITIKCEGTIRISINFFKKPPMPILLSFNRLRLSEAD